MSTLIHDKGIDPIGIALGFGERAYHRFHSPMGIGGLGKWSNGRLDILAVNSDQPGKGNFRRFLKQCQRNYRTICIWEVWNHNLSDALKRHGFSEQTEIQGDGETVCGLRWDRKEKAKP